MQVADEPLIDRLKELGMDFVADVLEGKVRPSLQQSQILSQGYTEDPVRGGGTVFIGGCADGRRIKQVPAELERMTMGAAPRKLVMIDNVLSSVDRSPFTYDHYRAMRIESNDWFTRVFVCNDMEDGEALARLVRGYQPETLPPIPLY